MTTKLTTKEKIVKQKKKIQNAGYESLKLHWSDRFSDKEKLFGTLYIKEKMDYGFHIYFIHEPSDTNKLAGKDGTLTEMYYDLRNRKYWIKRNLKEVNFSVRNIDSMFNKTIEGVDTIFDALSTNRNEGLYLSAYKYLGALGTESKEMHGRFFHRLITDYNYYELLYKSGVKLGSSILIRDRNGSSPMEILGISKTQWKMFSKFGIPISTIQKRIANHNDSDKDKKLLNYLSFIKKLENEYGVDKINEFMEGERQYIYNPDGRYLFNQPALRICKEYGIPENKFLRYIYFECDVSQGLDGGDARSQYSDYIRMTTEMGYERFDRYPNHLRTAHDVASRNYRIRAEEIDERLWNERVENNKEYEYAYGGYRIVIPKKPDEVIREGNVLSHCVASYVNKITKGLSTILFLRKSDDIDHPLVTVEVVEDRITQARGKMNNLPRQDEKEFLKRFAKKFGLRYN